jgi:pimeloyl-ACP methyl ester carboxylesterase
MALKRRWRWVSFALLLVACFLSWRCTHVALRDCGPDGKVLGVRESRIRSSHWRMFLADVPAAAARFTPYAAMSTLAYVQDPTCGPKIKITDCERRYFEKKLAEGDLGARWTRVPEAEFAGDCEDSSGLYYQVWRSDQDGETRVVVAFRGTWGARDWYAGNLHWITRWLPVQDQYKRAREYVAKVIDHFAVETSLRLGTVVRFTTTGHSLGGGLAQHALYTFPEVVEQAIVFNPSSVTGFQDQDAARQVAACQCDQPWLAGEPRILRVYDPREVLSHLRFFHKVFFPPERHIQEVRFENKQTHSMKELAQFLIDQADSKPREEYAVPWYAGLGTDEDGRSCTLAFWDDQGQSCAKQVQASDWNRCPQ